MSNIYTKGRLRGGGTILKVGGPGLKKLMSGGGGGGGGTPTHFFSDFKFFRHLYLIHVGVILLHAQPLW